MGLIDSIHCKMPLPEGSPDFIKKNPFFQTYDLGRAMGDYVITEDGQLQMQNCLVGHILLEALGMGQEDMKPLPINYKRKKIEIYASNLRAAGPRDGGYAYFTENGDDYISITFVVQIRNGKVSSIKEKHRSVQPALDYKLF